MLLLLLLLLVARVELRSLGVAPQLTKKEQMVSHPPPGGGDSAYESGGDAHRKF